MFLETQLSDFQPPWSAVLASHTYRPEELGRHVAIATFWVHVGFAVSDWKLFDFDAKAASRSRSKFVNFERAMTSSHRKLEQSRQHEH